MLREKWARIRVALQAKPNCKAIEGFLWTTIFSTSTTLLSTKKPDTFVSGFASSGNWTRTSDLRVMSQMLMNS
jgi:hypothetical protein